MVPAEVVVVILTLVDDLLVDTSTGPAIDNTKNALKELKWFLINGIDQNKIHLPDVVPTDVLPLVTGGLVSPGVVGLGVVNPGVVVVDETKHNNIRLLIAINN